MQVIDGLQLDVKQIADFAVRISGVADAVKLQVRITHSGFGGLLCEFKTLGELNSVGSSLNRVVSNLSGITHRVKEVRRQCRLATRELHAHLTPRLNGNGVVEHSLNF